MADDPKVRVEGSEVQIERRSTGHRVTLACANGHVWHEEIGSAQAAVCLHGRDAEGGALQVDLVCPACGKAYSVVGDVGRRACPGCGAVMVCPKCLAERTPEEPRAVVCPVCGTAPISVLAAPPVRFAGVVTKLIDERVH